VSDQAPKRSILQAAQRLFALMIIVALAGAVVWLLSERHERTYAVEEHDGELWIMRGRELPTGYTPYRPTDKLLSQAYANIPVTGDSPGELLAGPFDDRDVLDQAIFRTLKGWVESRLDADDADRLSQALKLLRRIELLTGVTAEQRGQLKELQAKAAWVEGRARLEEAEVALREAVAKLRTASETRGRFAREAGEMYEKLNPLSEQLSRTVRTSARPAEPAAPLPAEKLPPAAPVPVPAPAAVDAGVAAVPGAVAAVDGGS
jgi:hypothetical protein